MPLQTFIDSQKCFSQFRNGTGFNQNTSDYTTFLQGNIGERVKVETIFRFRWFATATSTNTMYFSGTAAEPDMVTYTNGDWEEDGFSVGDTVSFTILGGGSSTPLVFTAEITSLSGDILFINYLAGNWPTANGSGTTYNGIAGTAIGVTQLDSAVVNYNLVGNNDNTQFSSPINNENLSFYAAGIYQSPQTMQLVSTGTSQTQINGSMVVENTGFSNTFHFIKVTHIFIILPYYLQGYQTNLNNGTLPSVFNGQGNCLKYVIELKARTDLGNANSEKIVLSDDIIGNTGYYGQNFDGFNNNFAINSFNFSGGSNNIIKNGTTNCQVVINKLTGNFNASPETFQIGFSRAVAMPNLTPNLNYEDTFLYELITTEVGVASTSNNIIKNWTSQTNGNTLTINFDIDISPAQSTLIQSGDSYIVWVGIGNYGLLNPVDDRVNLLVDYNIFEAGQEVDGLIRLDTPTLKAYTFNSDINNSQAIVYDSFNGMDEDTYLYDFKIKTKAEYGAEIVNLRFNLAAHNTQTDDEFIIDNYDFNLTQTQTLPLTGQTYTEQNIQLQTGRGFNMLNTDQFNRVVIETIGTNYVSGETTYRIKIPFKINWEYWVANPDVNTVFFDNTKPNNNLNKKSSNYSNLLNYILYPRLDATVTNKDFIDDLGFSIEASSTNYQLYFPSSIARNYGDDSNPKGGQQIHDCTITTAQYSTGNDTSLNLLENEDVLVKAVFKRIDGQPMNFPNGFTGAIRIDVFEGGLFSIEELSTLDFNIPINNGLLKPLPNETRTKILVTANEVELSCLVNGDNVQSGQGYSISARLWSPQDAPVQDGNKIMENDTQKIMEDTTLKYEE